MTGPDHYLEAERMCRLVALDQEMEEGSRLIHLQAAQVHATLALAAASARSAFDFEAWDVVCGVQPEDGGTDG